MKKTIQIKKALNALLLLSFSCFTLLVSCKKSTNNVDAEKSANFSVTVDGAAVNGTEFLDESYITTNDEFLETAYAEIHIAGANTLLDVMIANPTVKQYSLGGASSETGVLINVNGTIYEPSTTAVLNITEATSSKIVGNISGTFTNVNSAATAQITNGSFTAQF
jgi:hypothetical protein